MDVIKWLGERVGCTPERVEKEVWDDWEKSNQLLNEVYNNARSSVIYSILAEKIKAVLIYNEEFENSDLEYLIKEIPDCEYLFLWCPSITFLPELIGQLNSLTALNISDTQISALPGVHVIEISKNSIA